MKTLTPYQRGFRKGFMNKCAAHGVPTRVARTLLVKKADTPKTDKWGIPVGTVHPSVPPITGHIDDAPMYSENPVTMGLIDDAMAGEDLGTMGLVNEPIRELERGIDRGEHVVPRDYMRALAKAEPPPEDYAKGKVNAMADYANAYLPQDIDKPLTPGDIAHAVTNAPGYSAMFRGVKASPFMGNMLLQRATDALGEAPASVRMPTSYELGSWVNGVAMGRPGDTPAATRNRTKGVAARVAGPIVGSILGSEYRPGVDDPEDTAGWLAGPGAYFVPSLLAADPKRQEAFYRSLWHNATSAVPAQVTSRVPSR